MAQGLGTFLRYFAVLAGLLALNYDFCKDIVGSYLYEKPNTVRKIVCESHNRKVLLILFTLGN